jgi:hypothetical protein
MVPMKAIVDKLQVLADAGIDIDKIPLDWTVSQLMEIPVPELGDRP